MRRSLGLKEPTAHALRAVLQSCLSSPYCVHVHFSVARGNESIYEIENIQAIHFEEGLSPLSHSLFPYQSALREEQRQYSIWVYRITFLEIFVFSVIFPMSIWPKAPVNLLIKTIAQMLFIFKTCYTWSQTQKNPHILRILGDHRWKTSDRIYRTPTCSEKWATKAPDETAWAHNHLKFEVLIVFSLLKEIYLSFTCSLFIYSSIQHSLSTYDSEHFEMI